MPGPPQGPIEYEEVTGNSVTISWRKPLDNGGSEITGYVIEKKDLDHAGMSQSHLIKFMWRECVSFLLSFLLLAFVERQKGREVYFAISSSADCKIWEEQRESSMRIAQ